MFRVGVVGYGMAGAQFHVPMVRAAGFEVAAVLTRDPGRAAQVAADLPAARVVPDLAALVASPGLDLVVVASPSGLHVEHARVAVRAGVPVVVDKPLAVDARSAASLVEEARARGVPLTVFQNRRYDPEFVTLVGVVGSGVLGTVRAAEFRWERWRPEPRSGWRERLPATEGGGLLLDLGTHLVDQAVVLFGPVASVYAQVRSVLAVAEDHAFLSLRHEGGLVTHVTMSSVAGAPGPRTRISGSRAAYLLGSAGGESTAFPDANGPAGQHGWLVRDTQREPVPARAGDPVDFYRAVAAALAGPNPQTAMPVVPADAVHVLAVIDGARVSAREQRVVDISTPGAEPGRRV